MKIVVTHNSPDWDAITSVWLIKRFLPGWENAEVEFVPAGERIGNLKSQISNLKSSIEEINNNKVIHVDTGMGPLDHHQTSDDSVCAASLTWEFVRIQNSEFKMQNEKWEMRKEAIGRIVHVIVAIDHFKEIFWPDAMADYQEFNLFGVLEGLKYEKPDQDSVYVNFGMQCLDALLHNFENRIWAEQEIQEKGQEFTTRFGKALGIETINDTVVKLAQKMGYVIVVRKDSRKGYVRIKARPTDRNQGGKKQRNEVNLTLVYEKLKKMDPEATWYLHVSNKMLLNGTPKNPKMIPTTLGLRDIIKVLESV